MPVRIPIKKPRQSRQMPQGIDRIKVHDVYGPAARGIANAANTLSAIREKQDTSAAHEAAYLFGETAREQFNQRKADKAGNAIGSVDNYREWFDKEAAKVGSGLSNKRQQSIFKNIIRRHRNSDLNALSRHEAIENEVYNKSIEDGIAANAHKAIAADPDNEDRINDLLEDMRAATNNAHPGEDNSARYAQQEIDLLSTALREQVKQNPIQAKAFMEKWRTRLGDAYDGVAMEVDKEWLYSISKLEHPNNFEKQYDFAKAMTDVDEDVKRSVMGRINADEAEAESREREIVNNHDKVIKENDLQAWIDFRQKKLTVASLDRLASKRLISKETYNGIYNAMKTPTVQNNAFVVGEIAEDIINGRDVDQALQTALDRGQIKPETYISFKTKAADREYKEGLAYISRAMKPGPFEDLSEDKHLRFAEAISSHSRMIEDGHDPETASREIVGSYLGNISRTIKGLPRPRYLTGDKTNRSDLEDAKIETVLKFANDELSLDEYKYQIGVIVELLHLASDDDGDGLSAAQRKEVEKRKKENKIGID